MMEFLMEKILFPLCFLFLIVTLVLLGTTIWQYIQTQNSCAKWEDKIVHQDAYTTFIFTGKVMMPIHHSAGDYLQNVCVEPKLRSHP